jgi:hypothetical protein
VYGSTFANKGHTRGVQPVGILLHPADEKWTRQVRHRVSDTVVDPGATQVKGQPFMSKTQ